MAHFAQVNGQHEIIQVVVVANDALDDLPFPASEQVGRNVLLRSGFDGMFFQCSYSASFRGAFPGIGWNYDQISDQFVPPKPVDES